MSVFTQDPFEFFRCPYKYGLEGLEEVLLPFLSQRQFQRQASQRGATIPRPKEDAFTANVDVQHFKPNEITVKVSGEREVTVEGKHEDKPDEHGSISRHFVRKFVIPEGYDMSKVESRLSTDGVLCIVVPKIEKDKPGEINIPVQRTGEPLNQDFSNENKKPDETPTEAKE